MQTFGRDVESVTASTVQEPARAKLDALACSIGFHVSHERERSCYSVSPAWPLWIQAGTRSNGDCVLYGVVRCKGQDGCRTDLNDWVSALWAINLRMWRVCSPFLVDEEGFCSKAERAARIVFFNQADVNIFRPGENDNDVAMLLMTTMRACRMISQLWASADIDEKDQFEYGLTSLPESFSRAFGRERDMDICGRRSGTISYFRRYLGDTSFTDFSGCLDWEQVRGMVGSLGSDAMGHSLAARLLKTGRLRNAIPRKDQRRLERLAEVLEASTGETLAMFPCESHLFSVTQSGILARRVNCGADRYAKEFISLQNINRANNSFLGSDSSFSWSSQVDPVRFEEMIHRLLADDPQVQRVKQVGHSNEPDGGRDCIAEVTQGFLHRGAGENALEPICRLIVQCKVSLKNVGKGAVVDIRDTVDRYGADGFLLVAFPGVTRPLVDYIESIRRRNLFWIDSWTKSDIEARLRANPSVAIRFPEIVTINGRPRFRRLEDSHLRVAPSNAEAAIEM